MLAMEKTMNDASGASRPLILVVEDHQSLRFSLVIWLQCLFPGSLVQGVESGEEALAHARNARPDVVLMDINLPGMDGIEATGRMKALAPTTAVVVLSTHDTPHHRRAAAKAGAAGYIAKRDMEMQLEATVKGLLRSRTRS
jgi:DNA-binding NarL/FixJ family response regulator